MASPWALLVRQYLCKSCSLRVSLWWLTCIDLKLLNTIEKLAEASTCSSVSGSSFASLGEHQCTAAHLAYTYYSLAFCYSHTGRSSEKAYADFPLFSWACLVNAYFESEEWIAPSRYLCTNRFQHYLRCRAKIFLKMKIEELLSSAPARDYTWNSMWHIRLPSLFSLLESKDLMRWVWRKV